ncbi:Hsp70 family protein [Pseudofrankia asymbiotica]|uniref:Molecular chaperone Hsp70 n=1 Tax=Pseudofrankia asymbiotica TaxID=1834516 RepID=A0A1V2I577_9ACTN|nr:Hsp70 family protein [Pseudofrankia asymbiotica]ONH24752.1 molecular chaperone Hsp70 [Pseudofrankia asymbiotica]
MTTLGIDLGTTYSCVAYIDDTGRPAIAKNRDGDDTTPSVVYLETPENVIVGKTAKRTAADEPDLVVALIKRQMGQDVELEFHGVSYSPPKISALILRELAQAAAEFTGEEAKDVVITVPAYFGIAEREATKNAGTIAGLNVLNVVPEPVAAALHYEVVSGGGDSTVLVYDLGGGTFDMTVIRISENDIRVVCTDGDHHLGGADWDERLAQHLLEAFLAEHPESEADNSEEFLQGLRLAAEDLKRELSSAQTRRHNMRFSGDTSKVEVTRETFEQITSDLLERTLTITQRTLDTAREKGVTSFDEVLLVGGSTRMPAVPKALADRFGFAPRVHDPDLAVAKGAARFALIESIKIALPDAADGDLDKVSMAKIRGIADGLGIPVEEVQELAKKRVAVTTPRAFGVKVIDGNDPAKKRLMVSHILDANTELAASRTEQYYTVEDNQTGIEVEIWEQKGDRPSPNLEDNAQIAKGLIDKLPPLPRSSPIDVTFDMDPTGRLAVLAVELSTGKELRMVLQIEGLSEEEVKNEAAQVGRLLVSN